MSNAIMMVRSVDGHAVSSPNHCTLGFRNKLCAFRVTPVMVAIGTPTQQPMRYAAFTNTVSAVSIHPEDQRILVGTAAGTLYFSHLAPRDAFVKWESNLDDAISSICWLHTSSKTKLTSTEPSVVIAALNGDLQARTETGVIGWSTRQPAGFHRLCGLPKPGVFASLTEKVLTVWHNLQFHGLEGRPPMTPPSSSKLCFNFTSKICAIPAEGVVDNSQKTTQETPKSGQKFVDVCCSLSSEDEDIRIVAAYGDCLLAFNCEGECQQWLFPHEKISSICSTRLVESKQATSGHFGYIVVCGNKKVRVFGAESWKYEGHQKIPTVATSDHSQRAVTFTALLGSTDASGSGHCTAFTTQQTFTTALKPASFDVSGISEATTHPSSVAAKSIGNFKKIGDPNHSFFTANDNHVVIATAHEVKTFLYDSTNHHLLQQHKVCDLEDMSHVLPTNLCVSALSKTLCLLNRSTLRTYNLDNGSLIGSLDLVHAPEVVLLTANGKHLLLLHPNRIERYNRIENITDTTEIWGEKQEIMCDPATELHQGFLELVGGRVGKPRYVVVMQTKLMTISEEDLSNLELHLLPPTNHTTTSDEFPDEITAFAAMPARIVLGSSNGDCCVYNHETGSGRWLNLPPELMPGTRVPFPIEAVHVNVATKTVAVARACEVLLIDPNSGVVRNSFMIPVAPKSALRQVALLGQSILVSATTCEHGTVRLFLAPAAPSSSHQPSLRGRGSHRDPMAEATNTQRLSALRRSGVVFSSARNSLQHSTEHEAWVDFDSVAVQRWADRVPFQGLLAQHSFSSSVGRTSMTDCSEEYQTPSPYAHRGKPLGLLHRERPILLSPMHSVEAPVPVPVHPQRLEEERISSIEIPVIKETTIDEPAMRPNATEEEEDPSQHPELSTSPERKSAAKAVAPIIQPIMDEGSEDDDSVRLSSEEVSPVKAPKWESSPPALCESAQSFNVRECENEKLLRSLEPLNDVRRSRNEFSPAARRSFASRLREIAREMEAEDLEAQPSEKISVETVSHSDPVVATLLAQFEFVKEEVAALRREFRQSQTMPEKN